MLDERLDGIKELLTNNSAVYVSELSTIFNVSPVTIRKDLVLLEKLGVAVRFHGGARIAEHPFAAPAAENFYEKEIYIKLATVACREIQNEDSIFLGSGKTCCVLARMLEQFESLSIVTNNVSALDDLIKQKHKIYLVGGEVATVDNITRCASVHDPSKYLGDMNITKAFTSILGVDLNAGLTVNALITTYLYKFISENANRWYVMADHTKFDHIALYTVEKDLKKVSCFITDEIDQKYSDYFDQNQVDHIQCDQ